MRLIPYINIVLALLFLFSQGEIKAQTASQELFAVEQVSWNFGDIAEDGGVVEHTFSFVNNTTKPVVILEVMTGCGCTTASYSRKPILKGERGEVKVVFNPMNMPGRFNKAASVLTSASSQPLVFKLIGNVIPRKKSVQEEYPFDLGDGVRMAINYHDFAYVGRGDVAEERVGIINTSSRSATIKLLPKEKSGLLDIICPTTLGANERGEVILRYSVDKNSQRYGTLNDMFGFLINGREARAILSTTAIAVDMFDRSVDDISLPRSELSKKIVKFGELQRGKIATDATAMLVNEGESDLIIRAIEWKSEALKCSLKVGDRIRAGERREVRVTFNSEECDYGVWVDRLKIITNDPVRPMQSIRLTAIIVE